MLKIEYGEKTPAQKFEELMSKNQMSLKGRSAIYENFGEGKKYLEWGSGGSTLWLLNETFNNYKKTQIISIEHNLEWFSEISDAVKNVLNPTEDEFLYLYKPSPTALISVENKTYSLISTPYEEVSALLTDYIDPPEVDLSTVDVFLVDGLARGACLASLRPVVKSGAIVFLHDIDKREEWYNWALKLWKDCEKTYVYHNLIKLEVK